ncbi:MAG: amidohydrolase [Lachnospiraceae bacterium]|nr:amidohydrolase [Lachnospiraceae bacterium]MCI9281857.1 amidohydrolase [Lachnospiraceae bacterium]
MRTLIEKAAIVTMDENENMWPEGYVLFDEESILAVGEGSCSQEADLRIDGKGGILMPGMVNVHSHISMMPFRSMGDDCPDRLRRFLFPLELAAMTPELVYAAARYAVCELLLSGVTSVLDMYYFEDRVASACEEMGIRAWVGETVIGQETCDSKKPYGGLALCEELIRKWKGHDRIHPLVAPHATNTSSPEMLKAAYELAEKYQVPYTLHVSEMDYEMRYFEEQYGKTPVAFLQELGVLGKSTIAVHCIHTTDTDIQIFARTGTKVAHCPGSNTKAGKGICPVLDMRGAGVSVGVGTDGPSSGNTLDLFTQLKMIACFQKTKYRDRSAFPAKEIVALGTMEGARVLGAEKEIGSIEVGKRADLVLLETQSANMFPVYNPYSVIVYSANASNVDSVWVQGRQLVRGHQLVEADLTAERRRLWLEMAEFQKQAKQYQNEI